MFVSDTHRNTIDVPEGDIFLHCGDWSAVGRPEETWEFLEWLKGLPHPHKVVVPGNHERSLEGPSKNELLSALRQACHLLIGQGVTVEGVQIWGSPMCVPFGKGWAFNMSGDLQKNHWKGIPEGLDVLVTHDAPFKTLDKNFWGQNVGSVWLRDRLLELDDLGPAIHAFGHIHERGGQHTEVDGRLSLNAAICDLKYKPLQSPTVVDYRDRKWQVVRDLPTP